MQAAVAAARFEVPSLTVGFWDHWVPDHLDSPVR
jgi:hypothetical protein